MDQCSARKNTHGDHTGLDMKRNLTGEHKIRMETTLASMKRILTGEHWFGICSRTRTCGPIPNLSVLGAGT